MSTDPVPPFRRNFDAARDPYAARNALGITSSGGGGGGGGAPEDAQYIVAADDPTLTNDRVLTDTATVTWDFATPGQAKANSAAGGGGTATPGPPQGRLTLVTATPVMTTTQSAQTAIFYTPYVGNQVPIYDGTSMVMTAFTELSNVTTASSVNNAGPAAVAASSVYDLFVWSDAGTVRLTRGPLWTNDTTRSAGTALVRQNGIWLNNAAITNGPAASRGTYVGTVRSNGSSQLDWKYGTIAANGGPGFFGVWNAYNRVDVASCTGDNSSSSTFTGTFSGPFPSGTYVQFVSGLAEDAFQIIGHAFASAGAGYCVIALGLDSTTTFSGSSSYIVATYQSQNVTPHYEGMLLGFHTINQIVASPGSTATLHGTAGTTEIQPGMWFRGKM